MHREKGRLVEYFCIGQRETTPRSSFGNPFPSNYLFLSHPLTTGRCICQRHLDIIRRTCQLLYTDIYFRPVSVTAKWQSHRLCYFAQAGRGNDITVCHSVLCDAAIALYEPLQNVVSPQDDDPLVVTREKLLSDPANIDASTLWFL